MNVQVTKLRLRDGVNYDDVKISKEQWCQRPSLTMENRSQSKSTKIRLSEK
jgi:hypothetical protein